MIEQIASMDPQVAVGVIGNDVAGVEPGQDRRDRGTDALRLGSWEPGQDQTEIAASDLGQPGSDCTAVEALETDLVVRLASTIAPDPQGLATRALLSFLKLLPTKHRK
ncbi:MAG: hypothetical protein ACOCZK_03870 [Planctomycetota bacterium]